MSALRHRPGLDGVRALAIAAVLLYHGQVARVPGGFLGVDLFFTAGAVVPVSNWYGTPVTRIGYVAVRGMGKGEIRCHHTNEIAAMERRTEPSAWPRPPLFSSSCSSL